MKSKSSTFILAIVALAIIAGLIYFFVVRGSSGTAATPAGLVSSANSTGVPGAVPSAAGGAASSTGQQVVNLLRNLSVIQLNDAVFQNPSYAMLQDIGINLPPVTNQGRRNPFASVGYDLSQVPSASATVAPITTQNIVPPTTP